MSGFSIKASQKNVEQWILNACHVLVSNQPSAKLYTVKSISPATDAIDPTAIVPELDNCTAHTN